MQRKEFINPLRMYRNYNVAILVHFFLWNSRKVLDFQHEFHQTQINKGLPAWCVFFYLLKAKIIWSNWSHVRIITKKMNGKEPTNKAIKKEFSFFKNCVILKNRLHAKFYQTVRYIHAKTNTNDTKLLAKLRRFVF